MTRRPRRQSFRVDLVVPSEATIAEVREYIVDAVRTWRGQARPPGSYSDDDPGDPIWFLDANTVKVVAVRPKALDPP